MPDILTHVLVGYILGTVLSFRYEWLRSQYVTVVMLGALVPDLSKIDLIVPGEQVTFLVGLPFEWRAVHMLGGALVAITIGTLLTDKPYRTRVFLLLALGAASHLFLDAFLIKPAGHSFAIFWPLTTYHPPTPGLFLSSDRWPTLVAGTVALVLALYRHRTKAADTQLPHDSPR